MMNGFLLNMMRALVVSGLTAVATALWSLNQKVATLDERVANVLRHSDRQDQDVFNQLLKIEERLKEMRK